MITDFSSLGIVENQSLVAFNTLAVSATARYFLEINSAENIPSAIAWAQSNKLPLLVLGGGSNVVLTDDFPGLVLQITLTGLVAKFQADGSVLVTVAAGENWDGLAWHCIAQGWHGLENLVAIPGCAGAAPIQNIGAYGVEISSVLHSVVGWNCIHGKMEKLFVEQCELAYRDSIFKHQLRDQFVITEICLRLQTQYSPIIHYPALQEALAAVGAEKSVDYESSAYAETVAKTVAAIRATKLPNPKVLPNAGSFFKNPIVDQEKFERLINLYPSMPYWKMPANKVKLAAAWLVDQSGLKGFRNGDVGIHQFQAIVVINYGAATGKQILAFSDSISNKVEQQFAVSLEIEPRQYPQPLS